MITQNKLLSEAYRILEECEKIVPGFQIQLSKITFKISNRMTSTAGKARVNTGEITLSYPYFKETKNFEKGFYNTVTHEIAHILSPPKYHKDRCNKSSHGPDWKRMHRTLGGDGKTCHELELAQHTTNYKSAKCSRCNQPIKLGPIRYKRYLNGTKYRHGNCNAVL